MGENGRGSQNSLPPPSTNRTIEVVHPARQVGGNRVGSGSGKPSAPSHWTAAKFSCSPRIHGRPLITCPHYYYLEVFQQFVPFRQDDSKIRSVGTLLV